MSTYKSYHDEPEQNYEEDVQVHGGGVDGGKPASFSGGGGGGGGNGGGGSEYLSGQNSDFNDLADTSLAIGFVALVIVRCVRRKRARAHRLTAALAVLYGLFGRPLLYAGALPSTRVCVCVWRRAPLPRAPQCEKHNRFIRFWCALRRRLRWRATRSLSLAFLAGRTRL